MTTPIDSLLTELGFEYNAKDLEKFNKDVSSSISTVKKLGKAVIASTAALLGFTTVTTSVTDQQGKLSEEVGVSIDTIDAFQFALKKAGGEANGINQSLRQLSSRASEAARGVGSGLEAFGLLSISVTDANGQIKQSDQLLLEISKKFEGLSKSRQIELAEKLGLTDSVRLLQLGEDGIKNLVSEARALGVATKEDAAISAEFQDSLTEFLQIIKDISRAITRELAPIFISMKDQFSAWWRENRNLIMQNLPAYFEKATNWLKLLAIAAGIFLGVNLFGAIASGISLVGSLTTSLKTLGGILVSVPGAILLAITSLAALAEDANVFFEGGSSVFGDLIEKFPEWATELKIIANIFNIIYDMTAKILEGWGKIFDLFSMGDLDTHLKAIELIGEDLLGYGKGVLKNVNETVSGISIGDILDFGPNMLQKGFDFAGSLVSGGNSTTTSTNVEKLEINVNGSGDPVSVAKSVKKEFQQASQDLNSVVYQ